MRAWSNDICHSLSSSLRAWAVTGLRKCRSCGWSDDEVWVGPGVELQCCRAHGSRQGGESWDGGPRSAIDCRRELYRGQSSE